MLEKKIEFKPEPVIATGVYMEPVTTNMVFVYRAEPWELAPNGEWLIRIWDVSRSEAKEMLSRPDNHPWTGYTEVKEPSVVRRILEKMEGDTADEILRLEKEMGVFTPVLRTARASLETTKTSS